MREIRETLQSQPTASSPLKERPHTSTAYSNPSRASRSLFLIFNYSTLGFFSERNTSTSQRTDSCRPWSRKLVHSICASRHHIQNTCNVSSSTGASPAQFSHSSFDHTIYSDDLALELHHQPASMAEFDNNNTINSATPATLEQMYEEVGCSSQSLTRTPLVHRLDKPAGNRMVNRVVHVKPHIESAAPSHVATSWDDDAGTSPSEPDQSAAKKHSYTVYSFASSQNNVKRSRGQRSHEHYCGSCGYQECSREHQSVSKYCPMDELQANSSCDPSVYAEDSDVGYTPSTLAEMCEQQRNPAMVHAHSFYEYSFSCRY